MRYLVGVLMYLCAVTLPLYAETSDLDKTYGLQKLGAGWGKTLRDLDQPSLLPLKDAQLLRFRVIYEASWEQAQVATLEQQINGTLLITRILASPENVKYWENLSIHGAYCADDQTGLVHVRGLRWINCGIPPTPPARQSVIRMETLPADQANTLIKALLALPLCTTPTIDTLGLDGFMTVFERTGLGQHCAAYRWSPGADESDPFGTDFAALLAQIMRFKR